MKQVSVDALRRVAERVAETARQQGAEGQVVVWPTGIRVGASAEVGKPTAKREIPWDDVVGPDFEQKAQEAFNDALAASRKAAESH